MSIILKKMKKYIPHYLFAGLLEQYDFDFSLPWQNQNHSKID